MPVADPAFGWQEACAAFAIVAIVSFLVTWMATDLVHVRRGPYVAILFVAAFGLAAGYLAWSGTHGSDLLTARWGWGIAAGLLAAAAAVPLVRRLPSRPRATGARLAGLLLCEGAVYGSAEAVLLATLPVLTVWQAAFDLGWTASGWTRAGSGALAVAASLLVILVHHLGYPEFRMRATRPKLLGALVTCGLQAVAFLVTGSALAPLVAHIALHVQMILRGVEPPPAASPRVSGVVEGALAHEVPVGTPSRDGART